MLSRRVAALAAGVIALTAVTALTGLGLPASPALAQPGPPAERLRSSYGPAAGEAMRRLAAESAAEDAASQILASLGDKAAGAWLDPGTGDLVVGVVDPHMVDAVHRSVLTSVPASRFRWRPVSRSGRELAAAKRRLDAHAVRYGSGRVASWYVDLPRNAVTVEVLERHAGNGSDRATEAFLTRARSLGDAVRISHVAGRTSTAQNDLLAGQEMDTDDSRVCSVGFHATDPAGRPVVLTAGHCAVDTGEFSRNGEVVGPVARAHFPVDDFAVVALESATWTAQPWVYRYGRRPLPVRGHSRALVGSTVCKSGGTTGWTCGRVVAHDVTVTYDGGDTVYGLMQASTCSSGGDSGGPLLAGRLAQGLLSGGRSIDGRCLEQYGMENVSYFQPVDEPLTRYGLRLLTEP